MQLRHAEELTAHIKLLHQSEVKELKEQLAAAQGALAAQEAEVRRGVGCGGW